ncbi:MAG TPA: ribosome small subunit-dependent GTPase A [Vicinamibacteria bacterium]|nr:ribosome small subunit-dependent GTPase A [Vicinamibacteria bacterium]
MAEGPKRSLAALGWNQPFEQALAALGSPGLVPARVAAQYTHLYRVWTEDADLLGSMVGRFRVEAESPADYPVVGDWVAVAARPAEGSATIEAVLPRRSRFVRKVAGDHLQEQVVAANVDTVFLVCGLDGDFNPRRIERALVLAQESGAQPVVILSKADLCQEVPARLAEVERLAPGVPVHAVSCRSGAGLADFEHHMGPGSTVALLGSSGVGKSTLINTLLGEDRLKTQAVRRQDSRGRHTTSHRELFLLPSGALMIDTPGIRELQLWSEGSAVRDTFDEVAELAESCAFRDCRHQTEPECAVVAAVGAGRLAEERLLSYRKLQGESEALARRRDVFARQAEKRRWRSIHKSLRHLKPRG